MKSLLLLTLALLSTSARAESQPESPLVTGSERTLVVSELKKEAALPNGAIQKFLAGQGASDLKLTDKNLVVIKAEWVTDGLLGTTDYTYLIFAGSWAAGNKGATGDTVSFICQRHESEEGFDSSIQCSGK